MTLADREWRLIREESWDGPQNMALDEIAAETAANGGPRTLRVYRWDPSTLSLGYRQEPETVGWEFCADEGITVTRRPTGGGGIYHDNYGDISYSIIAPADELPGNLMETYELLCEPIFDAFERMGVDARFTEENSPSSTNRRVTSGNSTLPTTSWRTGGKSAATPSIGAKTPSSNTVR